MSFLLCSGCARHIKSSEASCPFCGHDTEGASSSGESGPRFVSRSRAAMLFGGAALSGSIAIASCGDSTSALPPYGVSIQPPEDSGTTHDATAADAEVGSADASDAGSAGDAASVIFCSSRTIAAAADAGRTLIFCDDFDTVADPRTGWTEVNVKADAGVISLDDTTFASAPHSARFAYASDQFASFWMLEKVALPATYTMSFDLYFDAVPFEVELMRAVQLGGPQNAINLTAAPGSPSAMHFGVGGPLKVSDGGLMPTDTWHHVVAHVESDTVHLMIDQTDFGTFAFAREAGAPPGSMEIEVSPDTLVDAAAATAWFDNVQVTVP